MVERTNEYDSESKIAKWDRRMGNQTLKSLMGGKIPFVGARDPSQVKSQMDDDMWKANRISDVVPRKPDDENAGSEGK